MVLPVSLPGAAPVGALRAAPVGTLMEGSPLTTAQRLHEAWCETRSFSSP